MSCRKVVEQHKINHPQKHLVVLLAPLCPPVSGVCDGYLSFWLLWRFLHFLLSIPPTLISFTWSPFQSPPVVCICSPLFPLFFMRSFVCPLLVCLFMIPLLRVMLGFWFDFIWFLLVLAKKGTKKFELFCYSSHSKINPPKKKNIYIYKWKSIRTDTS